MTPNAWEKDMALTIFTLAGVLRPLRRLWRAVAGRPGLQDGTGDAGRRTGLYTLAGHGHVAWPDRRHVGRPLRVLRVVDVGHPACTAGRMVISGRMADVCAELDRLAALEAATV
ncbi:MAG: hypothetical protein NVS2B4_00720 [Ramlibacter sp.]